MAVPGCGGRYLPVIGVPAARHQRTDRVAYLHDSPEGENPRSEATAHYRCMFKHLAVKMLVGGIRPATTRRQPASVR